MLLEKEFLNKRGVSPLIASVLLIAFTLMIALFVSEWTTILTKRSLESAKEITTKNLYCDNVFVSLGCDGGLKNNGLIAVNELLVRKYKNDEVYLDKLDLILKPGDEVKIDVEGGKIDLIPIILDNGNKINCGVKFSLNVNEC